MGFAGAIGLLVAALVALPYFAHRLKRRHAEERAFALLKLVPPLLPKARRRAELEDRPLLSLRVLAVVALTILGASPLVRCSRVTLSRGGASVAVSVVLDDSMSMRANDGTSSRFRRAKGGALELLSSLREGDSVSLVLAGAPARVALAPTVDLVSARAAIESAEESDRGTDLEGALALSVSLSEKLPQVDKRAVIFSDRADGHPEGSPLAVKGLSVWYPLPDLAKPALDCGIVEATRAGAFARVSVVCSDVAAIGDRVIELVSNDKVLAHTEALEKGLSFTVSIAVPPDASGDLRVRFSAGKADAIASDDVAPVIPEGTKDGLAILSPRHDDALVTGGPPVVEQALLALKLPMSVRPLPLLPDSSDDLAPYAGLVMDDPPGFTPEQRKSLETFLRGGGVALLALGPSATAAPIGASLAPVLTQAPTWRASTAKGLDVEGLPPELASNEGLGELGARAHATLGPDDIGSFTVRAKYTDSAPFFLKKPLFAGEVWVLTLPFSLDHSDLALRPAMVDLLEAFATEARARTAPRRTPAGTSWLLRGANVRVRGPVAGSGDPATAPLLPLTAEPPDVVRATPGLAGAYALDIGGRAERRVVSVLATEIDFRPRPFGASTEGGAEAASQEPSTLIDVSWVFALVVLVVFFVELVYRTYLWWRRNQEVPASSPVGS